ncbi:MAG: 30S ribosomal protein S10 [Haloarculaceae archaeon]
MPFVTTLTLQSGDRELLDEVVTGIKTTAERKGVELKGPFTDRTRELRVPLPKRLPGTADDPRSDDAEEYDPWNYAVYTRRLKIVGHDEFARAAADRRFPPGVHVDVTVERINQPGRS